MDTTDPPCALGSILKRFGGALGSILKRFGERLARYANIGVGMENGKTWPTTPEEALKQYSQLLARLRLRPTRRVYWRSHSGGSGALIDAFIDDGHTTAWPCQVVSRLPSGTSPLMALTVQSNASVNRQSAN